MKPHDFKTLQIPSSLTIVVLPFLVTIPEPLLSLLNEICYRAKA